MLSCFGYGNEAVGNTSTITVVQEASATLSREFTGRFVSEPLQFTEGCAGFNKKASPPGRHRNRRLNSIALLAPLRSVQFSSGKQGHRQDINNVVSACVQYNHFYCILDLNPLVLGPRCCKKTNCVLRAVCVCVR